MTSAVGMLALEMLVGDQTILGMAREVSEALDRTGVEGGIVGGIAVFLHGHERTTLDIDVYTTDRQALADDLQRHGWVWNASRRQFEQQGIPVQLLAPGDEIAFHPTRFEDKDGIRTVALGDLVSMKLGSGTKLVHRAQDLADVVRLIELLPLGRTFTPRVAKQYRKDFQRLVDAVERRE